MHHRENTKVVRLLCKNPVLVTVLLKYRYVCWHARVDAQYTWSTKRKHIFSGVLGLERSSLLDELSIEYRRRFRIFLTLQEYVYDSNSRRFECVGWELLPQVGSKPVSQPVYIGCVLARLHNIWRESPSANRKNLPNNLKRVNVTKITK